MSFLFKNLPIDDGPTSDCHLTMQHLNFIRTLWLLIGMFIVIASVGFLALMTACAHLPVTIPNGPSDAGDVVYTDLNGFTVDQQGFNHLIGEGALPAQFEAPPPNTPTGYYITNGEWRDINAIRLKRVNTPPPAQGKP